MKVFNQSQNSNIAHHAEVAETPLAKLVGLLGRDNLPQGHALIIPGCRSIHMFFMKFAIDVLFVDKNNRVIGCVEKIKPFRMSPYFLSARYVIELPEGTIAASNTAKGDLIQMEGEA